MNLPKTAREAKLEGSNYYYTGKPCVNGHVTRRLTSTRACYECHLEHVRNRLKKDACSICNKKTPCGRGIDICEVKL
jgi:hypothetical protein